MALPQPSDTLSATADYNEGLLESPFQLLTSTNDYMEPTNRESASTVERVILRK